MMSGEKYSLKQIEWVRRQVTADAQAMGEAKLLLNERLRIAQEEKWPVGDWHGYVAAVSVLEMGMAHLDSRMRFYNELVTRIKLRQIENIDEDPTEPPKLSVIVGGKP